MDSVLYKGYIMMNNQNSTFTTFNNIGNDDDNNNNDNSNSNFKMNNR